MARLSSAFLAFAGTLSPAAVGWACPACPIGKTAREQVLASGFAQNLLIALAPFILIGATCLWVERIGKRDDGDD
jgi:hypothetical protein